MVWDPNLCMGPFLDEAYVKYSVHNVGLAPVKLYFLMHLKVLIMKEESLYPPSSTTSHHSTLAGLDGLCIVIILLSTHFQEFVHIQTYSTVRIHVEYTRLISKLFRLNWVVNKNIKCGRTASAGMLGVGHVVEQILHLILAKILKGLPKFNRTHKSCVHAFVMENVNEEPPIVDMLLIFRDTFPRMYVSVSGNRRGIPLGTGQQIVPLFWNFKFCCIK